MANKETVELGKLGAKLHQIVLKANEESKARILHDCNNAALKMHADIMTLYYPASGLNVITQTMIGGYRPVMDVATRGDESYIQIGIRNEAAQYKGYNYSIVHEFGCAPYTIRAKGRLDAWGGFDFGAGYLYWPGAEHPVKEVHHPGQKARKIATKSVKHQGYILVNKLLQEVHW